MDGGRLSDSGDISGVWCRCCSALFAAQPGAVGQIGHSADHPGRGDPARPGPAAPAPAANRMGRAARVPNAFRRRRSAARSCRARRRSTSSSPTGRGCAPSSTKIVRRSISTAASTFSRRTISGCARAATRSIRAWAAAARSSASSNSCPGSAASDGLESPAHRTPHSLTSLRLSAKPAIGSCRTGRKKPRPHFIFRILE